MRSRCLRRPLQQRRIGRRGSARCSPSRPPPKRQFSSSPLQRACPLLGHTFRRGQTEADTHCLHSAPQPVSTGLLANRPRLQAWSNGSPHPLSCIPPPQPVSTGLLASRPRLQAWSNGSPHPLSCILPPQPVSTGLLASSHAFRRGQTEAHTHCLVSCLRSPFQRACPLVGHAFRRGLPEPHTHCLHSASAARFNGLQPLARLQALGPPPASPARADSQPPPRRGSRGPLPQHATACAMISDPHRVLLLLPTNIAALAIPSVP